MTIERYSNGAMVLHWAIALLLVFQLGLGWHMTSMSQSGAMFAAFQLHKSVGMLVLALTLLRIGIRLLRPPPAPVPDSLRAKLLAGVVHLGLYAFMIAGPLTGWMLVSTAKIAVPTRLFGLVQGPHLPLDRAWHGLSEQGHELLAWVGLALIAMHLAGAIRHHPGEGGHANVIGRMIPLTTNSAKRALPAAFAMVGLLAAAFFAPWMLFLAAPVTALEAGASPVAGAPATPASERPKPAATQVAAQPLAAADASDLPSSERQEPSKWRVMDGGKLGFVASMNDAAVEGRFERWTASIKFDPDALDASRILVRVALPSVTTANADRDQLLRSADFFGSASTTAVFRSSRITRLAGGRYAAAGTLMMNGKSRPVTLAFQLDIDGDLATVSGSGKLDRTAFGIGSGQWADTSQIAAGVRLEFSLKARRDQ